MDLRIGLKIMFTSSSTEIRSLAYMSSSGLSYILCEEIYISIRIDEITRLMRLPKIASWKLLDHFPIRQNFELEKYISTAGKSILNFIKL